MIKTSTQSGLVKIELLILFVVVLVVLVTVWSAYVSAQAQSRDQQRLSDVGLMQKALGIYFKDNGAYPDGQGVTTVGAMKDYVQPWPTPPSPNGSCTEVQNQYLYSQILNGSDYILTFCLGGSTNGLAAGVHTLSSQGIK